MQGHDLRKNIVGTSTAPMTKQKALSEEAVANIAPERYKRFSIYTLSPSLENVSRYIMSSLPWWVATS